MGHGAKGNKQRPQGAQGLQEQLGKDYGKHSSAPQAFKRNEGGSVDLCGPAPHQGGIYPIWIWYLPEP